MVKELPKPATVEQTHQLGAWLDQKGYAPEAIIEWLKSKHYTVNNLKYRADRVASFVSGRISMRAELNPAPKSKSRPRKS